MKPDDFLTIIFSSTVISTFVAKLLEPLLERLKFKLESGKYENERRYEEKKELKQKRENIYKDAIHLLLLIRGGFNNRIIRQIDNIPLGTKLLQERLKEINDSKYEISNLSKVVAPLMRIYATDEIYKIFSNLAQYGKYSYTNYFLIQPQLYTFDNSFAFMCKKMQENLELRNDDVKLPIPHICPLCGEMHNEEEDCPKCGTSWVKAVEIEDDFKEKFNTDMEIQSLCRNLLQKSYDPGALMVYPLDLEKWKKEIKSKLRELE